MRLKILYDQVTTCCYCYRMSFRGITTAVILLLAGFFTVSQVRAQTYNALEECTTLSPLLDDIHTCMDNYLDTVDGNMAGITDFLAEALSGESLTGLTQSQQAFIEYRRQNCLWYLNFSSPRSEAEQIAKNCLVNMSQRRVSELQSLLTNEDQTGQTVAGYYVYGPERNSFQLCGSDARYWLEGDAELVSQAQQTYLTLATSELQVLHVVFVGIVDEQAQVPAQHQGVFQLSNIVDISLPTESDCSLPGKLSVSTTGSIEAASQGATDAAQSQLNEPAQQDEPQQQLIAYFGAWLVDCTENNGARSCRLEVALEQGDGTSQTPAGEFALVRQEKQVTQLELVFPGREIDSPARIRWTVDAWDFGDIVGSDIRVDESATRQLVPDNNFLRKELLPWLIKGAKVTVSVLEDVDSDSGETFSATLRGLTRSLAFADEFVREAAQ